MDSYGTNDMNDEADVSSSLDHALLESLFYNEMAMMSDDSMMLPSGLVETSTTTYHQHHFNSSLVDVHETDDSTTSTNDTSSYNNYQNNHHHHHQHYQLPHIRNSDPNVAAEKALLRDFGVIHSQTPPPAALELHDTSEHSNHHHQQPQHVATAPSPWDPVVAPIPPSSSSLPAQQQQQQQPPQVMQGHPHPHGFPHPQHTATTYQLPIQVHTTKPKGIYHNINQQSTTTTNNNYHAGQYQPPTSVPIHQQQQQAPTPPPPHSNHHSTTVISSSTPNPLAPAAAAAAYNPQYTHNHPSSTSYASSNTTTTTATTTMSTSRPAYINPASIPHAVPTPQQQPQHLQVQQNQQQPPKYVPSSIEHVTASAVSSATTNRTTTLSSPTTATNIVSLPNSSNAATTTTTTTTVVVTKPAPSTLPNDPNNPNHPTALLLKSSTPPPPPVSAGGNDSSPSPESKRNKLVSQFATLASRLGITLPPQVLHNLTDAAATAKAEAYQITPAVISATAKLTENAVVSNNQQQQQQQAGTGGSSAINGGTTVNGKVDAKQVSTNTTRINDTTNPTTPFAVAEDAKPELLKQLQSTAAEAIAAASRKRSASSSDLEGGNNSPTSSSSKTISSTAAAAAAAAANAKPYSKRRKKPRLNECEAKLASLRAENEMLKRHLDNISNRTEKLNQERLAVEEKMKRMLEEGAPDEEVDSLVKNYADMYSDYGRKRDQELSFHLDQLQRLANPTNFTKMGLWTLGQQSKNTKNPIAGILQKELGINAQQGRKILEQRQKIQTVCNNLKECLMLLGKLKDLCDQKTKIFHDRMEKCREILAPKQVVKLLMWINENSSTLGSVCPGWGSEQIQSKTAANKDK